MPQPSPHRPPRSAPARTAAQALAVAPFLAACAGGPAPAPAPSPPPRELAEAHASIAVPGLEDRRFDHATYWSAIEPWLSGPWRVDEVGRSAEGRAIRRLRYGDGPTAVLLWSQMHGNESTASMALADLVRWLHEGARRGDPAARLLADSLTIHLIPMLNPDGAERFRRRNAQGIDVNRDARRLETPEGRTLKAVRDEVEPDFGFNLHDQSAAVRVGDSDRQAAIALLAPAFNAARDVDAKRRRAMQVASLLVGAMEPLVGGHIAKYDDTFNPRAFGDLMGAWGASTVLVESGGWADDPQKQYLRRVNFVGIVAALHGIATGAYAAWDPAIYEGLAYNGRRLPDLLLRGGTLAVPGLPTMRADVLVDYERPLLREGGTISDVGDLEGVEAQDTLDLSGMYLVPLEEALDEAGGLDTGAPAWFVVAEDAAGRRVRWRMEGTAPVRVVPAPGADLHVEVHDGGDGIPLLVLHGFAARWRPGQWRHLLDSITPDRPVIGVDVRGHGRSGRPHRPSDYGIELVHDVGRVLDAVGVRRAHVLGYSMGGIVGLKAAELLPERVATTLLLGQGWADRDVLEGMAAGASELLRIDTLALDSAGRASARRNDARALSALVAAYPELLVEREALAAVEGPLEVIVGSEDARVARARALVEARPGTALHVLEGRTHGSVEDDAAYAGIVRRALRGG